MVLANLDNDVHKYQGLWPGIYGRFFIIYFLVKNYFVKFAGFLGVNPVL